MIHSIIKKSFIIFVIFLFIGVFVKSGISVSNASSINDRNCGCEVLPNSKQIFLEQQLNKLQIFTKLLIIIFNYNIELKKTCNELLNFFNTEVIWEEFCDLYWNIMEWINDLPTTTADILCVFLYHIYSLICFPFDPTPWLI